MKYLALTLFNTGIYDNLNAGHPREAIELLIANAITILLVAIGILSVIFIIIGGFQYVTSAGNEGGVQSAKRTIIAAVGGLVASIALYGVLSYIFSVFGLPAL